MLENPLRTTVVPYRHAPTLC